MVRIILMIMMFVFGYASNVINISYFPSNNKIDVLLSLDEPFDGKVIFVGDNKYKITGVNIDRIEQKKFKNGLNLIISGADKSIEFKMIYPSALKISPSVTAKGYGLRIRITGFKIATPIQSQTFNSSAKGDSLSDMGFNWFNYVLVIVILLVLMIVLLVIKKRTISKLPKSLQKDNYKLLYQRVIDAKNKLVLIEVFDKRYLLLLGSNNNILLDNFSTTNQEELKDISTQDGFEHLLDSRLDDNTKNFINKASRLREIDEI